MRIISAIGACAVVLLATAAAQQSPAALRIVVIEGEGGVNIIQQKTAVRPLVEVRDRNNVPVAGASVTFTIGGGGQSAAFAGGAQTLTVTTNAAGQAAASGLNAVSSGAFQIQVQAAYQGQVATAAISQTNFATAAAASQAGAGAGGAGSSSAAGGAAGGGGGVSGTTLGIVGAAVGGGALAATQLAGKGDEPAASNDPGSAARGFDGYDGTLSGQMQVASQFTAPVGPGTSCTYTRDITGTIRIELAQGHATGRATVMLTQTEIAVTGTCFLATQPISFTLPGENTPVSGGPSALSFAGTATAGGETYTVTFNGAESGTIITGTLRLTAAPSPGANPARSGSTTLTVTLRRP